MDDRQQRRQPRQPNQDIALSSLLAAQHVDSSASLAQSDEANTPSSLPYNIPRYEIERQPASSHFSSSRFGSESPPHSNVSALTTASSSASPSALSLFSFSAPTATEWTFTPFQEEEDDDAVSAPDTVFAFGSPLSSSGADISTPPQPQASYDFDTPPPPRFTSSPPLPANDSPSLASSSPLNTSVDFFELFSPPSSSSVFFPDPTPSPQDQLRRRGVPLSLADLSGDDVMAGSRRPRLSRSRSRRIRERNEMSRKRFSRLPMFQDSHHDVVVVMDEEEEEEEEASEEEERLRLLRTEEERLFHEMCAARKTKNFDPENVDWFGTSYYDSDEIHFDDSPETDILAHIHLNHEGKLLGSEEEEEDPVESTHRYAIPAIRRTGKGFRRDCSNLLTESYGKEMLRNENLAYHRFSKSQFSDSSARIKYEWGSRRQIRESRGKFCLVSLDSMKSENVGNVRITLRDQGERSETFVLGRFHETSWGRSRLFSPVVSNHLICWEYTRREFGTTWCVSRKNADIWVVHFSLCCSNDENEEVVFIPALLLFLRGNDVIFRSALLQGLRWRDNNSSFVFWNEVLFELEKHYDAPSMIGRCLVGGVPSAFDSGSGGMVALFFDLCLPGEGSLERIPITIHCIRGCPFVVSSRNDAMQNVDFSYRFAPRVDIFHATDVSRFRALELPESASPLFVCGIVLPSWNSVLTDYKIRDLLGFYSLQIDDFSNLDALRDLTSALISVSRGFASLNSTERPFSLRSASTIRFVDFIETKTLLFSILPRDVVTYAILPFLSEVDAHVSLHLFEVSTSLLVKNCRMTFDSQRQSLKDLPTYFGPMKALLPRNKSVVGSLERFIEKVDRGNLLDFYQCVASSKKEFDSWYFHSDEFFYYHRLTDLGKALLNDFSDVLPFALDCLRWMLQCTISSVVRSSKSVPSEFSSLLSFFFLVLESNVYTFHDISKNDILDIASRKSFLSQPTQDLELFGWEVEFWRHLVELFPRHDKPSFVLIAIRQFMETQQSRPWPYVDLASPFPEELIQQLLDSFAAFDPSCSDLDPKAEGEFGHCLETILQQVVEGTNSALIMADRSYFVDFFRNPTIVSHLVKSFFNSRIPRRHARDDSIILFSGSMNSRTLAFLASILEPSDLFKIVRLLSPKTLLRIYPTSVTILQRLGGFRDSEFLSGEELSQNWFNAISERLDLSRMLEQQDEAVLLLGWMVDLVEGTSSEFISYGMTFPSLCQKVEEPSTDSWSSGELWHSDERRQFLADRSSMKPLSQRIIEGLPRRFRELSMFDEKRVLFEALDSLLDSERNTLRLDAVQCVLKRCWDSLRRFAQMTEGLLQEHILGSFSMRIEGFEDEDFDSGFVAVFEIVSFLGRAVDLELFSFAKMVLRSKSEFLVQFLRSHDCRVFGLALEMRRVLSALAEGESGVPIEIGVLKWLE